MDATRPVVSTLDFAFGLVLTHLDSLQRREHVKTKSQLSPALTTVTTKRLAREEPDAPGFKDKESTEFAKLSSTQLDKDPHLRKKLQQSENPDACKYELNANLFKF